MLQKRPIPSSSVIVKASALRRPVFVNKREGKQLEKEAPSDILKAVEKLAKHACQVLPECIDLDETIDSIEAITAFERKMASFISVDETNYSRAGTDDPWGIEQLRDLKEVMAASELRL